MTASDWHKIENNGDPWQPTCWLQMAHNDDDDDDDDDDDGGDDDDDDDDDDDENDTFNDP